MTYKNVSVAEIKKALAVLDERTEAANKAETAYDAAPESLEAEAAFNTAYARQWFVYDQICKMLVALSGIDYKVARRIVNEREKLDKILA